MRIGIDTQSTYGSKTGIGHYSFQLLSALRQVASTQDFVEFHLQKDLPMRTDQRLWWQQIALPFAAKSSRVDLLHVTGFDAPYWKPCPIVLTVHDLIGKLYPGYFPIVSRFYWSWWLPQSIRNANRIIAVSEHTKNDLLKFSDIQDEIVTVVYPGIDPTFRPFERVTSAKYFINKRQLPKRFILFVGTIEPRKGLDTLVTSFNKIASQTSYDMVICGKKGWYVEALEKQIYHLGLDQRIHFTGYIPDNELPLLYNLATLFVFPSRYEGFGLPPLEAMACGLPVICSNAASLPEVVGDASVLIQPDDPEMLAQTIMTLLEDKTLQNSLRSKGFRRASQFTWVKSARQILEIYEKVL